MVSCKTEYLQLPELRMHYAQAGEGGNTVLFIHSYGASWRWWRGVMESLPDDFRALAVDVRGSGESDKPETGHTVKQMAEDVYQFACKLGLKDLTMVGHSMGGAITINFALEHPELLKSMVLVDPAPADGLELPAEAKAQMLATFKSRNPESIAQVAKMMAFAPDAQVQQAIMDELVDDALKASDAFLEQAMADMEKMKLGDRLSGIDLPALMVHGDRDAAVPLADSIKTSELISGCGLQVFYGCGHSPQIEVQEEFVNLLISFVRNPRRRLEEEQ